MSELHRYTTDELVTELARRNTSPRCRCLKWNVYLGEWDRDGYTWRCRGCLRSIDKCGC